MAKRILCFIGFLILAGQALAHSFYPVECCSGYDCAPIAMSRVEVNSAGFLIDGIHSIPFKEVRRSPDGAYHACFPQPDKLRCFFAPSMS